MSHMRASKGLTLIELLVVITIMMVMLGIVGGSTITSVDRAKAQVELIAIHNLIKMASVSAFVSGNGMQVYFRDNKTSVLIERGRLVEKSYDYLQFPEQVISFNRNGFPDAAILDVAVRSKKRKIELEALLGNLQVSDE